MHSNVLSSNTPPPGTFSITPEDSSFQPVSEGFIDNNYSSQQQQIQPPLPPSTPASGGCLQTFYSCFQISALQKYFDIDTDDVKARVVGSLRYAHVPGRFLRTILNCEGKNADLYGPFWICMTLSWFLAVSYMTPTIFF